MARRRKAEKAGEPNVNPGPVVSSRQDVQALLTSGELPWIDPKNPATTVNLNWLVIYRMTNLLPATGSSIVNNKTCAPMGALWTLLNGEPCPLEYPRIIQTFGIPWAFSEGFWRGWDYGGADLPIEQHHMTLSGLRLPGDNARLLSVGAFVGQKARSLFLQEIPHLPYDRTPYRRK